MFTSSEIAEITGGKWIQHFPSKEKLYGGTFDTRIIQQEKIFFAWSGKNGNGHNYLHQLDGTSIRLILVETENFVRPTEKQSILLVKNTLESLQQIAHQIAMKFQGTIIAITGSSGKTTTKTWLNEILKTKFQVHSSSASFNNHIGCPITTLSLKENQDILILEMGTSKLGEIQHLTKIVEPHISALVNVGHAHVGKLGSYSNILKAKSEIFTHLREPAYAFLPKSLDFLRTTQAKETTTFGENSTYYNCQEISPMNKKGFRRLKFQLKKDSLTFLTDLVGEHIKHNLCLIIAIAEKLGMTKNEIAKGLAKLRNMEGRGKIVQGIQGMMVLDDCYNANPESLLNMLKTMDKLPHFKKIAVIGNLSEQDENLENCRSVMMNQVPLSIKKFFLIGETSEKLATILEDSGIDSRNIKIALHQKIILQELKKFHGEEVLIGFKGSRSSKLENLMCHIIPTF